MQIFFSDNGITATSANHLANITKELYEHLVTELHNIRFYSTEIEVLSGSRKVQTQIGLSESEFAKISNNLEKISECKAFIAYLREAIKAKEDLTTSVSYSFPEGYKENLPPKRPEKQTKEDILNTWPLDKISRYYRLQAFAATYGESVHVNGSLSSARKDVSSKLCNPTLVDLNGSNTIITTYTPTVPIEKVDELFFNVQKTFRTYQAELNGLNAEIEKTIKDNYFEAMQKYETENQEFMNSQTKLTDSLNEFRRQEKSRVEQLKIIIPDNLKNIYNTINNLSKK